MNITITVYDIFYESYVRYDTTLRYRRVSGRNMAEMLHKLGFEVRRVIIISYSSSALSLYISTIRPLDPNKLASSQDSSNPPVADDHLLPATSSKSDAVTLDVSQSAASVKYDALGPLVVNSDGTLSRITNWPEMTPAERERTFRVLVARNKIRLVDQDQEQGTSDSGPGELLEVVNSAGSRAQGGSVDGYRPI